MLVKNQETLLPKGCNGQGGRSLLRATLLAFTEASRR